MDPVKFRPITRRKDLERIRTRYATGLQELESLGFEEVSLYYDFAPPYNLRKSFTLSNLILQFLVKELWVYA